MRTTIASGLLAGALAVLPASLDAQSGTPSRPSTDCDKDPNCGSGQWGINKAGYALLTSLSTVQSYLVCMAHVGAGERSHSVYLKVDNRTVNFGAGLGAPLTSGGCAVVAGKKIEVINLLGSPIGRIQGHYRRLKATPFTLSFNWMARPSGTAGNAGDVAAVYEGPSLSAARMCFAGNDATSSDFWANQRNLVVNRQPLTRSDGTAAVFSRHTCVDIEGTGVFAWRDFDTTEAQPIGGSFMFTP